MNIQFITLGDKIGVKPVHALEEIFDTGATGNREGVGPTRPGSIIKNEQQGSQVQCVIGVEVGQQEPVDLIVCDPGLVQPAEDPRADVEQQPHTIGNDDQTSRRMLLDRNCSTGSEQEDFHDG